MNDTMTLALTRAGSPDTSFAAAQSIPDVRRNLKAVYAVLKDTGPSTHEELIHAYELARRIWHIPKQSESGIRSRVKELVRLGFAKDTGETRAMSTGRQSVIWEAL